MPLEYIFPRVSIDESNAGPRPTPAVSLSTIGLVGTFSKGPVNVPTTIGSLDQLVQTFGGYKAGLTGYVSALGAFAQGASDFKVVRVGGAGIASAALTLKDSQGVPANSVVVTAKTPGTWGNDVKVAVAAGTNAGTFKLIVTYGSKAETFDNLTLANVAANVVSEYVTAAQAAGATQIPANLASTPLAGGNDGANTVDSDYIGTVDGNGNRTGLKALEAVRCAIVLCAQQSSAAIQNALITHCANVPIGYGLRVAILNTAANQSVDQAAALTSTLDSARAILAYPWVELTDLLGQKVAPDGAYAGRLAVITAHQSPSNKEITGIASVERLLADADIKTLTQAKISPISLVEGRGFRIRNGVNLSSDPAWSQTNIRREFDKLEMEIYGATQWAISENNTPALRAAIAAQIDNMLSVRKQQGEIYDFKPTICDDTNNTPATIQARILNTTVRIRPSYAADFIDHSIQRLVGNE